MLPSDIPEEKFVPKSPIRDFETNQNRPEAEPDLLTPEIGQQASNQAPDTGDDLITAFTQEEERESSQEETISDFLNSLTSNIESSNVTQIQPVSSTAIEPVVGLHNEKVSESQIESSNKAQHNVITVNFGDQVINNIDNIDNIEKPSDVCEMDVDNESELGTDCSKNLEVSNVKTSGKERKRKSKKRGRNGETRTKENENVMTAEVKESKSETAEKNDVTVNENKSEGKSKKKTKKSEHEENLQIKGDQNNRKPTKRKKNASEAIITEPEDLENYCKNCNRTFKRRATFVKHICLVKVIKKEKGSSDSEDVVESSGEVEDEDFVLEESEKMLASDSEGENQVYNESSFGKDIQKLKTVPAEVLLPETSQDRGKIQTEKLVENEEDIEKLNKESKLSLMKGGKMKNSVKKSPAVKVKTEPVNCPECDLVFKQDFAIKFHKCTPGSDKYHCETCNKMFGREAQYTRHVTIHERTHRCDDCKVTFSTKSELDRHECHQSDHEVENNKDPVEIKKRKKSYHCSKCSQVFENHKEMSSHVSVCDPDCIEDVDKPNLKFYSCKSCKNVYSSEQGLISHCDVEHKVEMCKICGAECISEKALQRHMKKHNQTFICEKCGRSFVRKEALLTHYSACSPEKLQGPDGKDLYFACDKCNKIYETELELNEHTTERHTQGTVTCEICGYEFDTLLYLYRHMATHTDQYSCVKCGKSFARNESLLSHYVECYPEALDGINGMKKYYPCTKCRKVFAKPASLENHLRSHENAFRCDVCKKNFGNASNLDKHNCGDETEDGEFLSEWFCCAICGKGFNSKRHLDRHAVVHSGEFTCKFCLKMFSRKSELQRHELQCMANIAVEQDGKVKCSVCEEEFEKVKEFTEHYREHTHAYKCQTCERKFLRRLGLENHKCMGSTEEQQDYVRCTVCNKMFKNELFLKNHMKTHNDPPVECSACGKSFDNYKMLLKPHKCIDADGNEVQVKMKKLGENKYIMTKTEPLICPLCGKMFPSTSNLNKHMITHGEKNEVCKICGKKFHLKTNLAVHMDSHEKIGRHQCGKCGKRLKNVHSLHIHMKHMHDESYKGHKCPECPRMFKQRSNMLKHQVTHLDKRTFVCKICSKSFKCKEHLTRHNIWHVYGERFQCEVCSQRFVMKHELTRHEKLYHSGYMYECPYCKIVCRLTNTMKRHLSRRHDDIDDWKENTIEFIKKGVVFDEKYKELPPDVIKQEETEEDTDSDETTLILQAESQDGNPPQTFVIKGNGMNHPITQEVAEALQNLSTRGVLETQQSQQNATISIIGDIQSSSGESIPVAYQSGGTPDSEGYIIVPVVDKSNQEHSVSNNQEISDSFMQDITSAASTVEEENMVYNVVSDSKQTVAQLNTVAAHYGQISDQSQQMTFEQNQNESNVVPLDEVQLLQSGLNQSELLKALQSNNVQLVIGDQIGGVTDTDQIQSHDLEIAITEAD